MSEKKLVYSIGTLFIYVIIYTLMIIVFYWLNYLASETKNVFKFPSIVLHISPIVMIFFGMLLNFEKIIGLIKEKGSLSIDWLRFLIVVIPLTAISFLNVLQYSQAFKYILLSYYVRPPVVFVAQFLQGFLLVNCFSKNHDVEGLENGKLK